MSKKAQASLEAMLCFAAFMAIAMVFVGVIGTIQQKAAPSLQELEAKSSAEKCALLIGLLYSNSAEKAKNISLECYSEGEKVFAKKGSAVAESAIFGKNAKIVSIKKESKIEVQESGHYK